MDEAEEPPEEGTNQDADDELICNDGDDVDPEYDPIPTGNDEDGWDYGDASPDDDLDNADWPKQTPDTVAAIEAQIAAAPRRLLFLRGLSWYIWLDYRTLAWTTDSPDASAAAQLLNDAFPSSATQDIVQSEDAMRELYAAAVKHMQEHDIRARVLD